MLENVFIFNKSYLRVKKKTTENEQTFAVTTLIETLFNKHIKMSIC